MIQVRLKQGIKKGIFPTNVEEDVLREIGRGDAKLRTDYFTIRAKLSEETGYGFDETAENAISKLLNLLLEKDILEPCSAGKKQEEASIVAIGPLASSAAVEALANKGIPVETVSEEEQKWANLGIKEDTAAKIKPLLETLINSMRKWQKDGIIRGAIVKVHEKKEGCKMVRLLVGATKEPGAIEADIIIAQCHNLYTTILAMNKGIGESKAPKHPINEALLLTKSEKTKVTFMLDLKKECVLMLETPKIKRVLIFMEMEEAMTKIIEAL